MKSITVKGKVVNGGEVETQFTGKNLTPIGGIKLFDKFARKLGVGRALEQSMKLQVVHCAHSSADRGDECKPAG
jgi:hypothetical protein